jgi:DivIVA domain-containing protein
MAAAMTMDDADPGDLVLNPDEVRNVRFGKGIYDASQVSALLDRIAAELDAGRPAGRPAGPLIANATFRRLNPSDTPLPYTPRASVTASPSGYDTGAVDWFLGQLRRREDPAEAARMNADPWHALPADPYCIRREPGDLAGRIAAPSKQECADAWRDFAGSRAPACGGCGQEPCAMSCAPQISGRWHPVAVDCPQPSLLAGEPSRGNGSAGHHCRASPRPSAGTCPTRQRTCCNLRLMTGTSCG